MVSGIAAGLGNLAFGGLAPEVVAGILAFAALAMLAETMVPEAFQDSQPPIGLITVVVFPTAFLLIKATS